MEWKEKDEYLLLKPSGRLDAMWYEQWADTVLDIASKTPALLILVDLQDTQYASSSFLRFLIILHKEAVPEKKVMLLFPQPAVMQILEVAGFDSIFHITGNLQDALNYWRNNADTLPAVKEDGVHSEFTCNGYFHFSGNLPSTAPLLQGTISPNTPSTLADLAPSLCVGAGMSTSTEGSHCALFLGRKIVIRHADGPVQVCSDMEAALTGTWPEPALETVMFDRLDDSMDFGCRWPDKGILFSELAFDVLRLARERRTDPGHAIGFLMIHDHPDNGGSDMGRILHVCSGLVFAKEDIEAFVRPLSGAFVSEKGVGLYGASLSLSISEPFDFRGSDVFSSAERLLGMGSVQALGLLNPNVRVGKLVAGLTCFSRIIG